MEIKYYIRYFNPLNSQFVVLYYTDLFPNGIETNIGLPFNQECDGYLCGDDLIKYIKHHAPVKQIRERERIMKMDTSYIDNLIANQDASFQ